MTDHEQPPRRAPWTACSATLLVLLSGRALGQNSEPPAREESTQDSPQDSAGTAGTAPSRPLRGSDKLGRPGGGAVRIGTPQPADRGRLRPGSPQLNRELRENAGDVQADDDQPDAGDGDVHELDVPADEVELSAFAEGIELRNLIELLAETLEVNVSVDSELEGSVVFNAPVRVKVEQFVALVDALLAQKDYAIVYDPEISWYFVIKNDDVEPGIGGDRSTTKVIRTPNVKPDSLRTAIESQFFGGAANLGDGQMSRGKIAYMNEIGAIVVTDTPRRIMRIEQLVREILAEKSQLQYITLDIRHLAATVARERAIKLVGGTDVNPLFAANQGDPRLSQGFGGGSLTNLPERLIIDPQGNGLIFRGLPEEEPEIRALIAIIDRPNTLEPKRYFTGSATRDIARFARSQGLVAEIVTTSRGSEQDQSLNDLANFQDNAQGQFLPGLGQQSQSKGGPVMIVDESRQTIVYYGTAEQQAQLDKLLKEFDTQAERIVIREYKLRFAKAEEVAELVNSIIQGQQAGGESPLLPGGGGGSRRTFFTQANADVPVDAGGGAGDIGFNFDTDKVFVVADQNNNQVIVKAPVKQQTDIEALIGKLDLRRPQVYIQAQIVAVTNNDSVRFAVESQLINAGGTGGALNTNFGLGSFGTGSDLTDPKNVSTSLTGITAAIIKSDQVPIVINAIRNKVKGRIVSSPQLLVDDNAEAEVASIEERQTLTTSQADGSTLTSRGEPVEAGTKLGVTPTISEGGAVRMELSVELSNFVGEGTDQLPPPKQTRNIDSQVTIPGDSTIVVGGIVVDDVSKTTARIPWIGDVPLLGALFGDTRDSNNSAILYVFITPRIVRDPNYEDLRLLTRGPQAAVDMPESWPEIAPAAIPIMDPPKAPPTPPAQDQGTGVIRRNGGG